MRGPKALLVTVASALAVVFGVPNLTRGQGNADPAAVPSQLIVDNRQSASDSGGQESSARSDTSCDQDSGVAPSCCHSGNVMQSGCGCDCCRALSTCSADPYNRLLPQGGWIRV